MRPLALAVILALALTPSAFAKTSKCRDAQGHYVKCPPAASSSAGTSATAGAASPAKAATPAAPATPMAAAAPSTHTGYSSHTSTATSTAKTTAAPAAAATAGAPAGATAQCKDGTFSMSKSHSGACSHHGGVASWMK